MVQAVLRGGIAVASFAAAALVVLAIVRVMEHRGDGAGVGRPGPADRRRPAARRLPSPAEPAWWPEFERAFAHYVRSGERRRS